MAELINGRNVVLYKYDGTTYESIPFACATECTLTNNLELKEITNQSSANFREFKPDMNSWSISGSGFVILNTEYNYLSQLGAIINRELLTVKFIIDNGGVNGLSIFTGTCYLISHTTVGADDNLSTYSIQLQGTGVPSLAGTTVTPGGVIITGGSIVQVFQLTATEGQTSLTFSGAIGLDLLYGSRGGITIQPIGTLSGNGGTWNISTGVLTLATPTVDGEEFIIMCQ